MRAVVRPENAPLCRSAGASVADSLQDEAYDWRQVTRPAWIVAGNPAPRYPEVLMRKGVQGRVLVTFVVDVDGCADMSSIKVLSATDERFVAAVRDVLPYYRFRPAELDGRKVRQWVELPFEFSIHTS